MAESAAPPGSASAPTASSTRGGPARGGRGGQRGRGRGRGAGPGGASREGGGKGGPKGTGGGGGPGKKYFPKGMIADGSAINRPGVFVSCDRGREKACESELYGLFNQIADELYPDAVFADDPPTRPSDQPGPSTGRNPAHPAWLYDDASNVESEATSEDLFGEREEASGASGGSAGGAGRAGGPALSFEEELARELSELKKGKDIERFYGIPTATDCTVFIAMKAPLVPSKMCLHYLRQVKETGVARLRYALRLVPVDAVGPANVKTLEEIVPPLSDRFFAEDEHPVEGKTWRIVYNSRSSPKISRSTVTENVPKLVPEGLTVNLSRSDYVVLVEVFKSIMGVSFITDFDEFKKYNVQEVVAAINGAKEGPGELSRAGKKQKTEEGKAEDEVKMAEASAADPAVATGNGDSTVVAVEDPKAPVAAASLLVDVAAAEEHAVNEVIGGIIGNASGSTEESMEAVPIPEVTSVAAKFYTTSQAAGSSHPIPQKPAADVPAAASAAQDAAEPLAVKAEAIAQGGKPPADTSTAKAQDVGGESSKKRKAADDMAPSTVAEAQRKQRQSEATTDRYKSRQVDAAPSGMGMAPKRDSRGPPPSTKTGALVRPAQSHPPQPSYPHHEAPHQQLQTQPHGPWQGSPQQYQQGQAWQHAPGPHSFPPSAPWQPAQPVAYVQPSTYGHIPHGSAWPAYVQAGPHPQQPYPYQQYGMNGASAGMPPPVPYASRPETSGAAAFPGPSYPAWNMGNASYTSVQQQPRRQPVNTQPPMCDADTARKPKKPPAWKRGEPIKRDRKGRCWHCGAGREHAAQGTVERDADDEEAPASTSKQAAVAGKRKKTSEAQEINGEAKRTRTKR